MAAVTTAFLFAAIYQNASAQGEGFGFDASLNVYTESPYSKLPLKSVRSMTLIEGPVAKSHIEYTFVDGLAQRMEVGANFHLPDGTILDGFGYYYGTRYIRGKIYDNDDAWKIYTAVTSRGRDPGIMDRPDKQDYHTQIYPVLPGQYLRVIVDITQLMPAGRDGARFTLPLQQPAEVSRDADIDARVEIAGVTRGAIISNYSAQTTSHIRAGRIGLRLAGDWLPKADWQITIPRVPGRVVANSYSRLSQSRGASGAYAATITAPYPLEGARIAVHGDTGARLASATLFGNRDAYAPISFTGRYARAGKAYVEVLSTHRAPLIVPFTFSNRSVPDRQNPAAKLWADKRIEVLQDDTSRNRRQEVIGLSRRYTVVSNFTALLAIPREELATYRQRLAAQNVSSNTRTIGGGGGDPLIRVSAPAGAKQVVAVFPNGSAISLDYDPAQKCWSTRFDFPLGTLVGDYDVTIIVVHADLSRTRFILVFDNRQAAPEGRSVSGDADLTAMRGDNARIRVIAGSEVMKATIVAPWNEREAMVFAPDGMWTGSVAVPTTWPVGQTDVAVILYDGAHNRTEVHVDVDVR